MKPDKFLQTIEFMSTFITTIPLALYIHLPWCVRKCPYCDFNSHALRQTLPEEAYVTALLRDLQQDLPYAQGRSITSIFFGGGTPSLFSPQALDCLLQALQKRLPLVEDVEITLEANPGTVEQQRFRGFRAVGINRISLGIQSFQDEKLRALGRIHGGQEAIKAVAAAQQAGFTNYNLDLMYGLPGQTVEDAVYDLATAMALQPTHLSWYQLTLEPNTLFYQQPPLLPDEETIWAIQQQGQQDLAAQNYFSYEVSAYGQPDYMCRHNCNYWQFGDYLGIGAGAHSKITDLKTREIKRFSKIKHPKDYLSATNFIIETREVKPEELPLEFLMNALRLQQPVTRKLFEERTGLSYEILKPNLQKAVTKGLINWDEEKMIVTEQGKLFLNDLVGLFLP
ncbi:MAG: radical SAM family heme chaperone HemW [Gammaproteobacteria bacterium]